MPSIVVPIENRIKTGDPQPIPPVGLHASRRARQCLFNDALKCLLKGRIKDKSSAFKRHRRRPAVFFFAAASVAYDEVCPTPVPVFLSSFFFKTHARA